MQRESVMRSLIVATCLCIVCSVLVSSAAVSLKPLQEKNKLEQMWQDVLKVAGRYQEGVPVEEQFRKQVESRLVDLETGQYVDQSTLPKEAADAKVASRDPELSISLPQEEDLAGLKRRERYSKVFLVKDDQGHVEQVILPVRGKGLWSTMYGFLSLETDLKTVHGITFYDHAETPGLGGEIETEKFRDQWQGKLVRDPDGKPHFEFVRGSVDPNDPKAEYKIDGIAGATITTRGVVEMIRFWMGPQGFQPFLEKQAGELQASAEQDRRVLARR
jgi:Na+-transporting NADH:ubiquinone oxidoreductase subunit C